MKAGFSIKSILYFAPNCPQKIVAPNCRTPNCPRRIVRAELSAPNCPAPNCPDTVIIQKKSISTLELTICHETNATTSKNFKISKYKNLKYNLLPEYATYNLAHYTVEVTSLGFISDISDFCSLNLVTDKMPVHVEQALFRSVISSSYSIYCSRNAAAD